VCACVCVCVCMCVCVCVCVCVFMCVWSVCCPFPTAYSRASPLLLICVTYDYRLQFYVSRMNYTCDIWLTSAIVCVTYWYVWHIDMWLPPVYDYLYNVMCVIYWHVSHLNTSHICSRVTCDTVTHVTRESYVRGVNIQMSHKRHTGLCVYVHFMCVCTCYVTHMTTACNNMYHTLLCHKWLPPAIVCMKYMNMDWNGMCHTWLPLCQTRLPPAITCVASYCLSHMTPACSNTHHILIRVNTC